VAASAEEEEEETAARASTSSTPRRSSHSFSPLVSRSSLFGLLSRQVVAQRGVSLSSFFDWKKKAWDNFTKILRDLDITDQLPPCFSTAEDGIYRRRRCCQTKETLSSNECFLFFRRKQKQSTETSTRDRYLCSAYEFHKNGRPSSPHFCAVNCLFGEETGGTLLVHRSCWWLRTARRVARSRAPPHRTACTTWRFWTGSSRCHGMNDGHRCLPRMLCGRG
jgi:hypothetical protein